MSEYTANKAKGRDSSMAGDDLASEAKPGASASNQERFTDRGTRAVSANTGKFDSGNVVRMAGNSKGTGQLKQPTAVAMASRDRAMAASTNPDGNADRSGNRKAPGRN